jgi:hypothetical protein
MIEGRPKRGDFRVMTERNITLRLSSERRSINSQQSFLACLPRPVLQARDAFSRLTTCFSPICSAKLMAVR